MPDSAQEKTEQPTARRRSEARKAGQIARSTDLTAAIILMGVLLLLNWYGRSMLGDLLSMARLCLDAQDLTTTDADQLLPFMAKIFRILVGVVLPVILLVLVLALVGSYLQIGYLITFQSLKPALNRLNPANGIKRFFNVRSVVQLLMAIAKMTVLGAVAYSTIRGRRDVFAHAPILPYLEMVGMAAELFFMVALRLAIALLILGIIDYIYQRYKTEKDLKMTKEEVKDELRNMEGDPKVRSRRRQIQLELALQRIRSAVPKADVVITNPTELAIAIRYDPDTMNAPRVTAKGADYLARRIREIAIEHGIPIVERKPLAQALYRTVEVGQEIPSQFYKAIAEILAYVYELSGKRYAREAAAGVAVN